MFLSVSSSSLLRVSDFLDPHSFPTRRSSDLTWSAPRRACCAAAAGPPPATSSARSTGASSCRLSSAWPRRCCCWQGRRSEEHTSELQSRGHLVCRLLLEKTILTIVIVGALCL